MPLTNKNELPPSKARILALLLLFLGIILGIFTAPNYWNGMMNKFFKTTGSPIFSLLKVRGIFSQPYRQGLDIQGGTHLVYLADLKNSPSDEPSSMEALRDVIERRVNLFGVAEPLVQVEHAGNDWRLIVELAGVRDISSALRLIGATPFLEFRSERPPEERDRILELAKKGGPPLEDPYFAPTPLTGQYLKRADITFDPTTSEPRVTLEFNDEGTKIFSAITKNNVGKRLAVYLDGAPISAPVVQEEITGGKAQITGNFTPQAAKELVGRLNAGALPVPIKLIAQESVEASLGSELLKQSFRAGVIGFLLVAIFMILWYRLPGILAVLALLIYAAISLSIFKLVPVTITVAGIVGFILSIGMAVDANILIFERIKEELRRGKILEDAIREGFARAWTSIRDSNISSLITSFILYWVGKSSVKGFALTLGIGILVSMFSAIIVTRTFLLAVRSERLERLRFLFLGGIAKQF